MEEASVSSFFFMRRYYPARLQSLRARLHQAGLDGFLSLCPVNIFYLCGFTGSAGALLVENEKATLVTDCRYATQSKTEVLGAKVRIAGGAFSRSVSECLGGRRKWRLGYEPSRLSVSQLTDLRRSAGGRVKWVPMPEVVEQLRSVKDQEEVATLRRAARLGSEVVAEAIRLVHPGITEIEMAAEIEYRMKGKGASGPAFETIVASGARSALPHARPAKKRIRKNELVMLDLGAILAHYCCDLTRTVYVGRVPSKIQRWYRAVKNARDAACHAIRAGVRAAEVDAAARAVLTKEKLERYFIHGTGHGIGLEVHEAPRLSRGHEAILETGNVVTVEPGVYVEGVGGIRIEDDVLVTDRGSEVLTRESAELVEL